MFVYEKSNIIQGHPGHFVDALSFHAGLRAQMGAVKRLASGTERNPLTKKPMCI